MQPAASETPGRKKFRSPSVTPAGLALVLAALAVLIRSLYARNAYEVILSSAILLVWFALLAAGLYGARKLAAMEFAWKPDFPVTANAEAETLVAGLGAHPPRFFRVHFLVRGRFYPQGMAKGCPVRAETSAARGETTALLKLAFPMGGVFRGEGSCRLRDISGFFSFECGERRHQSFNIRSVPGMAKNFRLSALSGAEDRRTKTASDEERYYMREYSPGDRFRDINWKSSERIDTLITRISPDNQEKVSRIEVYFRNFGPADGKSDGPVLGELWLLDRAKARLAWFLRSVKDEQAAYIFVVHTANESRELKDENEIDAFLEELAGLPFAPSRNEDFVGAAASGDLYVFSTACDAGLGAFVMSQRPRPLTLFLARYPERDSAYSKADSHRSVTQNVDTLLLRNFPAQGIFPLPRWLRSVRERPAQSGGGARLEIDYAEVKL